MGAWDELLNRHRPVLRYDSHEIYFAGSAAMWTDNPANVLRRDDGTVLAAAEPEEGTEQLQLTLQLLRGDFYGGDEQAPVSSNDVIADTSDDYVGQATLFQQRAEYRDRMYGRWQVGSDERVWLQYWFFYFYNSREVVGYGLHEGDWEMIQLRLDKRNKEPDLAVYAQHKEAERRDWADVERVDKDRRPVIYVALGSHAAYFTPGSHDAPFGQDRADGRRPPAELTLEIVTDETHPWTLWPGRWGGTLPQDRDNPAEQPSPLGPCRHDQWDDPAELIAPRDRPLPVPSPHRPPAAPALSLARSRGGRLRIEYSFPPPSAAFAEPERLLVSIDSPDDDQAPQRFSYAVTGDSGSILAEAGLQPQRSYDVFVSALTADAMQGESVGLLVEPVPDAAGGGPYSPASDVSDLVGLVRGVLGSVAGIIVVVYLTGALVLALRLAFADLPPLGVVGQLPRDALVTLGAAEILLPALGFVALHLLYRGTLGMQGPLDRHRPWFIARTRKVARTRHLLFLGVVPFLLVVPGAALAMHLDHDVPEAYPVALLGLTLLAGLVGVLRYRRWRRQTPDISLTGKAFEQPSLKEKLLVIAAGGLMLCIGAFVGLATSRWAYLGLGGAWLVCFAFAMAYVFARGTLGESFRSGGKIVRAQILMSLLVMLLAIPALVVFWSGWTLPEAAVCTATSATPRNGALIGQNSDGAFLGDDGAITTLPSDQIRNIVVGRDAQEDTTCPAPDKP